MLKLTTKIALAALVSISALSTAEASHGKWGDERFAPTGRTFTLRSGSEYDRRQTVRVQRNNSTPVSFDRDAQEYSLSRNDIYGQPASTCRGGSLGYSNDGDFDGYDGEDYAEESFSDKAKRFVSNHKKEILIGTAILTAVVGTVSYFMSMGQNEEEQNPSYHPGVVHDPVLDIAADIAAKAAREAAEYAAYQARMGLNMVGSPETAVTVWEEPTVFTAVVNTASHWLSGFTRQFYGS